MGDQSQHAAQSNSWSTPPGGVDAEIVNVGGGTDAELDRAGVQAGKHRVHRRAREAGAWRVAAKPGRCSARGRAGAVGVLLGQTLPAYNQQERIARAINFSGIAYDIHRTNLRDLRFARGARYARRGVRQGAGPGPRRHQTVFENPPRAKDRGRDPWVAGARSSDSSIRPTCRSPGANDNATGVGLLAEMARTAAAMLKAGQINPARTITMLWGVEIQQTRELHRRRFGAAQGHQVGNVARHGGREHRAAPAAPS